MFHDESTEDSDVFPAQKDSTGRADVPNPSHAQDGRIRILPVCRCLRPAPEASSTSIQEANRSSSQDPSTYMSDPEETPPTPLQSTSIRGPCLRTGSSSVSLLTHSLSHSLTPSPAHLPRFTRGPHPIGPVARTDCPPEGTFPTAEGAGKRPWRFPRMPTEAHGA